MTYFTDQCQCLDGSTTDSWTDRPSVMETSPLPWAEVITTCGHTLEGVKAVSYKNSPGKISVHKWCSSINSLDPEGFYYSLQLINFKLISMMNMSSIFYQIAIRWMPQHLTDHQSTLVQVMAWCCQATSHYLIQCWPRSLSPYYITRPQWVNSSAPGRCGNDFKSVMSEQMLWVGFMSTSCKTAFKWLPQDTFDDMSTFTRYNITRCHQATGHYLSQCYLDLCCQKSIFSKICTIDTFTLYRTYR